MRSQISEPHALVINRSVEIIGPGAEWLTLSGSDLVRHFEIVPAFNGVDSTDVSITGLTLTNGFSTEPGGSISTPAGPSGSIDLNLSDIVIADSQTDGGSAALGGAIAQRQDKRERHFQRQKGRQPE